MNVMNVINGYYLGIILFILSMVFLFLFIIVNVNDKNTIKDSFLAGLLLLIAGVLFGVAVFFLVNVAFKEMFYGFFFRVSINLETLFFF